MNALTKLIAVCIFTFPLAGFADTDANFKFYKNSCLEDAKQDSEKTFDPESFMRFQNKLCECTAEKIKDIDPKKEKASDEDVANLKIAYGTCLAQSFMTETMDRLENEDAYTQDNISSSCLTQSELLFPKEDAQGLEQTKKHCICIAKEVVDLDEKKQSDTDVLQTVFLDCAKEVYKNAQRKWD